MARSNVSIDAGPKKETYAETVAARIIDQLERGVAPWQRPWNAGELAGTAPTNAVTGKRYRGGNALYLTMQGRDDPRWLTYKQAAAAGAQVRQGERGCTVQYYRYSEEVAVRDEAGKIVKDEDGKALKREVQLDRPRPFSSTVFNAEQVDGLPARMIQQPMEAWERHEGAELILANSGVPIRHQNGNRACYQWETDTITLPEQGQFSTPDAYYATALHELGHATGHPLRLNREKDNPFGGEAYAREELRAEIASLMLGQRLETSHSTANHESYVASWVRALKDDPTEIFKAAADAEKITEFVMGYSTQQTEPLTQEQLANAIQTIRGSRSQNVEEAMTTNVSQSGSTRLSVPYKDKDKAKELGAKWDKEQKTWYAPAGVELAPLAAWVAGSIENEKAKIDPRQEFSEALQSAKMDVPNPVMDGTWQRVKIEGDKGLEKSGAYRGFLDGWPAGTIQNHREGIDIAWKASGVPNKLEPVDLARAMAESKERHAQRDQEEAEKHARTAKALDALLLVAPDSEQHPYFVKKGVSVSVYVVPGDASNLPDDSSLRIAKNITEAKALRAAEPDAIVLTAGDALIPIYGIEGELKSAQTISKSGFKSFVKGGDLAGGMDITVYPASGKGAQSPIVVTEGYATGKTCGEATGAMIVCAFSAGNLEHVARALREKHPDRAILIAGDNDHATARELDARTGENKPNRGLIAAMAAAAAVGGYAAVPDFNDPKSKGSDWNDLLKEEGPEALEKQLTAALLLADRRRLDDAHRLGHNAETVSQDIVQHQADAEQVHEPTQGEGVTPSPVADIKSLAASLRNAGEREADAQDKSDERGNGLAQLEGDAEPEQVKPIEVEAKKRSGGRKR